MHLGQPGAITRRQPPQSRGFSFLGRKTSTKMTISKTPPPAAIPMMAAVGTISFRSGTPLRGGQKSKVESRKCARPCVCPSF
jgi:hypothetical protein